MTASICLCDESEPALVDRIHHTTITAIDSHQESVKLVPFYSKRDEGYIEVMIKKFPHIIYEWEITLTFANIDHIQQRDEISTKINHKQLLEFLNDAPTSINYVKCYEKYEK